MRSVIRLVLAGLLLWAGVSKLAGRQDASDTMFDAFMSRTPTTAYAVLAVEIVLGLWLLSDMRVRPAAIATVVLLSAFSGALAAEMRKERPKPCGCLGAVTARADPDVIRQQLAVSLLRNGLMMAGACVLVVRGNRRSPGTGAGEAGTGSAVASPA